MPSCKVNLDIILSTEWATAAPGSAAQSTSYRLYTIVEISKPGDDGILWQQLDKPDFRMPAGGYCVLEGGDVVLYRTNAGLQELVARLIAFALPPSGPTGGIEFGFMQAKGYARQPASQIRWRGTGKWTVKSSDWLSISAMSAEDKLGESIKRSKPLMAPEAWAQVQGLVSPVALGAMAGMGTAWLISHVYGAGEIADAILLIAGGLSLGWAVFTLAEEVFEFARCALGARTEQDLDEAGEHFARAVAIGGVALVITLLTHRAAASLRARLPRTAGPPPKADGLFYEPQTHEVSGAFLKPGVRGITTPYGDVLLREGMEPTQLEITTFHEYLHRWFSPRFVLLRELRADLMCHTYKNSVFLRWLEEAMAQTRGELRNCGIREALVKGFKFPLDDPDVPVGERRYGLTLEILQNTGFKNELPANLIGTITSMGVGYWVFMSRSK